MKKAILFGRVTPERLILQLELESAEAIWMQMGTPPTWDLHTPGKDKQDHVELKLTDPQSNTRVPYAGTSFKATNTETGTSMELPLNPDVGCQRSALLRQQRTLG